MKNREAKKYEKLLILRDNYQYALQYLTNINDIEYYNLQVLLYDNILTKMNIKIININTLFNKILFNK